MQSMIIVTRHGLPPFLNTVEVAGQAQGGPADASEGLNKINVGEQTWAWNPIYDEWQLLRMIRSGDTLWNMSGQYYGERSVPGVRRIGNVEQNRPILGSSYDRAVPGDVILIPGLDQPGAAPPSPPPGGAQPPPGGAVPPTPPDLPPIGGIDWTSPEPPPNWPPYLPWPPDQVAPPDAPPVDVPDVPPPVVVGPGEPPAGAEPTPVGATTPGGEREGWWTTGRIALVGGLAVVTTGLIVWGATRGSKKRKRGKPRKRQRTPRRRRRS